MINHSETYPQELQDFIGKIKTGIWEILAENYDGFYIHGSIAMGGFNPKTSDVDIIVITKNPIRTKLKKILAQFFLYFSNNPYPIEISFLHKEQIKHWEHPCPYDFHDSEFWREQYQQELQSGKLKYIYSENATDPDLAAHFTIMNHRGLCIEGEPIVKVFPTIPLTDYLSAIIEDFEDCLENIEGDPIYCTLNLLRVYWFVKEGIISSKQEAGNWGLSTFPEQLQPMIEKVVNRYSGEKDHYSFNKGGLIPLRNYIADQVEHLLLEKDY